MPTTSIPGDDIGTFIAALQISIDSQIITWQIDKATVRICFDARAKNDPKVRLFEKMVLGTWNSNHQEYTIHEAEKKITPIITNFLMLTRLDHQNMRKLQNLDSDYSLLAKSVLSSTEDTTPAGLILDSLLEASHAIFSLKKGMTIRELSEKTGLSMVAISNFKAGKDIRLSNFLKIAKAIGLNVSIS